MRININRLAQEYAYKVYLNIPGYTMNKALTIFKANYRLVELELRIITKSMSIISKTAKVNIAGAILLQEYNAQSAKTWNLVRSKPDTPETIEAISKLESITSKATNIGSETNVLINKLNRKANFILGDISDLEAKLYSTSNKDEIGVINTKITGLREDYYNTLEEIDRIKVTETASKL